MQDIQDNVMVDGAQQNEPDLKPVRREVTVPLDWAVYNDGSRRATGVFYGLTLPAGVSFVQTPQGCVQQKSTCRPSPARAARRAPPRRRRRARAASPA